MRMQPRGHSCTTTTTTNVVTLPQHYVPTLLASLGLEHETDCHGELTYSQWEQGGMWCEVFSSKEERDGVSLLPRCV